MDSANRTPEERQLIDHKYRSIQMGSGNQQSLEKFIRKDDRFTSSILGVPVSGGPPPPTIQMVAEYDSAVRHYYGYFEDIEMARQMAYDSLRNIWSATQINGDRQVMKYPPEAMTGIGNTQDLRESLVKDAESAGITIDDSIRVVSTENTRETGAYQLVRLRPDGLPEVVTDSNGVALSWIPDVESIREQQRERDLAEANDKRAKIRRLQQEVREEGGLTGKHPDGFIHLEFTSEFPWIDATHIPAEGHE
jgi:hypothetical protein